jgi:hypothetical protein
MVLSSIISLFLFISVLIVAISGGEQLSGEQCLAQGFNNQVLQCSTCDHVSEILGDSSSSFSLCKSCCIAEAAKSEIKFKRAVLEVDKRTLPFSPELQSVVNKKKDLKLQVRNRYGTARLLMFAESGEDEPSEILSVHSWTKDTFEDYLKTHLVRE